MVGDPKAPNVRLCKNMVLKLSKYLYGIWLARSLNMGNIWTYGPPSQHAGWCFFTKKIHENRKKTWSPGKKVRNRRILSVSRYFERFRADLSHFEAF
jgi:hypothetical protein